MTPSARHAPNGRTGTAPVGPVVLGLDLGTTAVKAVLVDTRSGETVGQGTCAYPSHTPTEGAHEQDPDDWWQASRTAVAQALTTLPKPPSIAAVGLSGHMHAAALVDEADGWVRPVMTWADRRSAPQVRRLREHAELFAARCANPVVEAFTAPKVAWLAEHEPQALARARRMVQPKDALRHRLTGTWGTDVTDARGTLLYDVRSNRWDAELWELCGADLRLAPEVSAPTDVIGTVTTAAAAETGLVAGTPVVAGASDVACSALGAGVVAPGLVYVNVGTAGQIFGAVPDLRTGNHFVFGRATSQQFLAMGSVYAAGLSVEWAAESLLGGRPGTAESAGPFVDGLAGGARSGADGVVFLPHLLGTSLPTHDPAVSGALVGLRPQHGRSAVARAVLEGVAYACASAVSEIAAVSGDVTGLRVGGGLARSEVWASTMSAIHDVPVGRLLHDASPRGAAMLAALGVGLWSDVREATEVCVHAAPVHRPEDDDVRLYRDAQRRYEATARAVAALSHSTAYGAAQVEVPA